MLTVLYAEEISREESALSPYAFFFHCWVAGICVHVSVDASLVPLTWANVDDVAGSFEQLNLNTQT